MISAQVEKISVVVFEDNRLQLAHIVSLLEDLDFEVYPYLTTDISLKSLENNPPDLAILDIHLNDDEPFAGIKFGEKLKEKFQIPIIFITGYQKFPEEGKLLKPEFCLKKTYHDEDVINNVDFAIERYYGVNQKLPNAWFFHKSTFLRENIDTKRVKVSYSNYLYVEADNINTKVYAKESLKPLYHIKGVSLKNFNECLPDIDFCQIHRAYIVNLGHVTAFNRTHVFLGSIELPLGEAYRKEFERKMKRRM